MNNDEFIEHLREYVKQIGTQKQAAANLEISTAYLNDVLNGRREPGRKIACAFGLRKVIRWVAEDERAEWGYL